ncbi:MAG TPA: VWA domain-containing protein [Candidatus Eisenbacteria bacterium]|nr:VWA domain-containing protein [Candidatus Eisenbacteria bacterium]
MGGGHYDRDAHEALTATRVDMPKEQVFTQRQMHGNLNPYGVKMRESRDSENHPNSRAVIMVMDQTGSMGHIPHNLATKNLPAFMTTVIDEGTLPDVQVMMQAVGDAHNGERSPLQVGQFESEGHLIDQDLTRIHLEGNGGGNGGESYDLALYFAARHTSIDCWEKRGEKGYIFITGDDNAFSRVDARQVKQLVGDDLERDIPIQDIIAEASKRYHVFFLIPDLGRRGNCEASWRRLLGDNVICMESHEDTSLVAATLIGLTEGTYADMEALQKSLKKRKIGTDQSARVYRAVAQYAASIGRGGERPPAEDKGPPTGKGKGRARRL